MPSYVVKTAPDRDCYVIWSTVVDSPTFIGTRAETEAELKRHGAFKPERLDRADELGTSSLDPRFFGWADDWFMVMESLPRGTAPRRLPRANLEAFTRAADEDSGDDMLALTEPCEDAPEVPRA